MQLGEDEHLFVRLKLEEGRTAIVNFGPNTELSDLDLERGDRVVVRGKKRTMSGRDVIFARDVRLEMEPVELDWSPSGNRQGGRAAKPSSGSSNG